MLTFQGDDALECLCRMMEYTSFVSECTKLLISCPTLLAMANDWRMPTSAVVTAGKMTRCSCTAKRSPPTDLVVSSYLGGEGTKSQVIVSLCIAVNNYLFAELIVTS